MTKKMHLLAGALLIVGAFSAEAAPIPYTITFDASNTAAGALGPSGTGSFLYDAATNPDTMTSLTWDFGSGDTGGWTDLLISGSAGQDLFNLIFNNTVDDPTSDGWQMVTNLGFGFPDNHTRFCWGTASIDCGMANPLTALGSYSFVDSGGTYRGYLTVAQSTVPEPTTLALLGIALAGLAFSCRKRNV